MDYMFDAKNTKDRIVLWIKEWFEENGDGCKAVIGISGGKDSSVVAALCVEALGKDNVFGVFMPNGIQRDIEDAYKLSTHLGIKTIEVNIADAVIGLVKRINFGGLALSEQAEINLPPRIRMSTLYAVSQSINGRVACTDNLSESYIGYSTRWGDNVGDFCPLANLTSDEVIAIGDVLGLPYELTHKIPSDGLCGKSDEDNFGFTYEVLNKYIRTGVCDNEESREKIDNLHNKNTFKLKPIPCFQP